MKVTGLNPEPVLRVQFHRRDQKIMPDTSGCYVLTAFDGTILYIGLAKSLRRRFCQHLETTEKRALTNYGRATWVYYLETLENEINRLERTWLQIYRSENGILPVLNKIESPLSY